MKHLLVLLLTGMVFISCSGIGMETKREFKDHTFYAENPNLSLKLADTFSRIDQKHNNDFAFYANNNMSGTGVDVETYRYFDRMRMKEFVIRISKLNNGYWLSNLNGRIPNPLKDGVIDKHGQTYHYAIYAVKTPTDDCYLIKRHAKCFGAANQIMVELFYSQVMGPLLGDCSEWNDLKGQNPDKEKFLTQFMLDSQRDVEFLEKKAPEKRMNLKAGANN